ncbi:SDR family NAD(P)-dependent oxidoreductase [Halalkalibacter oceani]|uniref:SDR family NAD(P)-dependent oxidoreductase n=1 Tax=Halalkalibacter oceani TaxID=1653776 RepID=UPI003398187F
MRFENKTAIVTGSTAGFGKAIAIAFAKEGAKVAVTGRNAQEGHEVVRIIRRQGGNAFFVQAEMTDESSVNHMVEQIMSTCSQIDVLVNNVGTVFQGNILELSPADWTKSWQANVDSAYLTSRAVLPHMLKRKEGVIVNMGSTAAVKGLKNRVAYCTGKFALIGLTKALAVDHSKEGIRVNCICPGAVETEMVKAMINSSPDPEKTRQMLVDRRLTNELGTVEEIAEATLFLASPQMKYMTGAILSVDGGASVK